MLFKSPCPYSYPYFFVLRYLWMLSSSFDYLLLLFRIMSNLCTAGNYLPVVGSGAVLPCPAKPPQSRTAPPAGAHHPPPLSTAVVPVPGAAPRPPTTAPALGAPPPQTAPLAAAQTPEAKTSASQTKSCSTPTTGG